MNKNESDVVVREHKHEALQTLVGGEILQRVLKPLGWDI